jgi:hypothetical protein
MLFLSFPYDFPLLWDRVEPGPEFFDLLEAHLKFIHNSPALIPRILHIAITIGFVGHFIKLFKPSEANLLFDGASLVLYFIGVVVYITNIVKGLRIVTVGKWAAEIDPKVHHTLATDIVTREDTMRVLAASNTILALVLLGVLVLQAGEWYAERRDAEERAGFEKMQRVKKERRESDASQRGSAPRSPTLRSERSAGSKKRN